MNADPTSSFVSGSTWAGPTPISNNLNDLLGALTDTTGIATFSGSAGRKRRQTVSESLDLRTAHAACSGVIGAVRNQGGCGSCWAFAASGVAADALCIQNSNVSPQILSPMADLKNQPI